MSRSRHFCFTLNNYTDEDETKLGSICDVEGQSGVRYICFGYEQAPKTGTRHLQGFISYVNARSIKSVRKWFKCHVEICSGGPAKAIAYCKKDGIFFESGEPPADSGDAGLRGEQRWRLIRDAAERGDWGSLPDDVVVRYPRNLLLLRSLSLSKNCPPALDALDNVWLYGSTGSGKSRAVRDFARSRNMSIYLKETNKWWDGYDGEPLVLVEEFGPEHVKPLGELLKIWADHYPFRCEFKGGSIVIRPRSVIITSNYSMDVLFSMSGLLLPLQRRFVPICAGSDEGLVSDSLNVK